MQAGVSALSEHRKGIMNLLQLLTSITGQPCRPDKLHESRQRNKVSAHSPGDGVVIPPRRRRQARSARRRQLTSWSLPFLSIAC